MEWKFCITLYSTQWAGNRQNDLKQLYDNNNWYFYTNHLFLLTTELLKKLYQ